MSPSHRALGRHEITRSWSHCAYAEFMGENKRWRIVNMERYTDQGDVTPMVYEIIKKSKVAGNLLYSILVLSAIRVILL